LKELKPKTTILSESMASTDKIFLKCVSYIPRLEIKYDNLNTLGLSSFVNILFFHQERSLIERIEAKNHHTFLILKVIT
jgi:hypothetical protein